MSKIICDICGTSYPDTAEKCPICGSARSVTQSVSSDETRPRNSARDSGYTYVKGGRFSKANVKKRARETQKAKTAAAGRSARKPEKKPKEQNKSSNRVLIIIALCLLLAIVAVVVYMVFQFFWPFGSNQDSSQGTTLSTDASEVTTDPADMTTEPEDTSVACTGLVLSDTRIDLDAAGRAWLIEVTAEPADTTDSITFVSGDKQVATVSDQGRVTAVGSGETVITITCGSQTAQCQVVCDFEEETTAFSETTEAEETRTTTAADVTLSLNRSDITFASQGETFTFTASGLSNSQITWSIGNSSVATVSNGVVTAVGPGTTTLVASYGGQTAQCIIRCSFEADSDEEGTTTSSGSYQISSSDVTISVDESFGLYLYDESGNSVSVTWSVSDGSVCSVSGSTVTGLASGSATVSATYQGTTYSCIVRVKG